MRGGEHGPGGVETAGGEVQHVGGGEPEVDDRHPVGSGPLGERPGQLDPRLAHVAGHQQARPAGEPGHGHPDGPELVGVELVGDDPADVVGLKDVGKAGHGRAILASPPPAPATDGR